MLSHLHKLPMDFSSTIKKLTTGIILHDSSGKITQYNQAASNILGVDQEQLLSNFSYSPPSMLLQ